MKVVIIGGHITPALATMDALKELHQDTQFFFIGRKNTLEGDSAISAEYKLVTERKIPFYPLTTGRLQRTFTKYTLYSLLKIPVGFFQSYQYLRKLKPDVVVSFGGYLAVPVALVARMMRIPVVIHEQTLVPGLANKIIARVSSLVAVSFEESRQYYPYAHTIVVGNPIREVIFQAEERFKVADHSRPVLYVTGGNQGAHSLNEFIFSLLPEILNLYTVIHQTGNSEVYKDYEKAQNMLQSLTDGLKRRYYPFTYIGPEMIGDVYKETDIIVGRSGMNTLCEIIALGKRGLLIPIPNHKEQEYNARYFKKMGFGEMLEQEALTPGLFYGTVSELLTRPLELQIVLSGQKIIRKDAASILAKEIIKVAGN